MNEPPTLEAARAAWELRRHAHVSSIRGGEYQYFEMLRDHIVGGIPGNRPKILQFVLLPVLMRARRIVELGCAFSYFPETYPERSPWRASTSGDEGMVSTRAFLTACRFLSQVGVDATLTSVDVRSHPLYDNARALLTQLGLISYWRPVMGTDSIEWLRGRTEEIDIALIDSNHTYAHVRGELEGVAPLVSAGGLIIVDDCYNLDYVVGVAFCPDETAEGVVRGGEYGAVVEFLDTHREWTAEWVPGSIASVAFLRRKADAVAR